MKKEEAKQIGERIHSAQRALADAVEELRDKGLADAAGWCHGGATDLDVMLGYYLLGPLYREFPDLRPVPREGQGNFDASRFGVPAANLEPVEEALASLDAALHEATPLLEKGASTPGEALGFVTALAGVRNALARLKLNLGMIKA